jgi:uncharacterized protein YjlB
MIHPTLAALRQPVEAIPYFFADDGAIPNNPALPLLVCPGVFKLAGDDPARIPEQIFAANGWVGSWRNGIFPFPHYHSRVHEVLAICKGKAQVQLGGAQGVTLTVQAGDVVLIPAGVGHENLGASADLLVVGAYPPGEPVDLCHGKAEERPQVLTNIVQVPLPISDPVWGDSGPVFEHWRKK